MIAEEFQKDSQISSAEELQKKIIARLKEEGLTKDAERIENCLRHIGWYTCSCGKKKRAVAHRCMHRLCPTCAAFRAKEIKAKYAEKMKGQGLKFLTLTIKNVEKLTRTVITRLKEDFKTLRLKYLNREGVTGGLWRLEITYNHNTRTWHPHIHAIIDMPWIPQQSLSHWWREIRADGAFIVGINEAKEEHIGYMVDYLSMVDADVPLEEYLDASYRLRAVQPFGTWMQTEEPESEGEIDEPGHATDEDESFAICTHWEKDHNDKSFLAFKFERPCECGLKMKLEVSTVYGFLTLARWHDWN